MKYCSNCGTTLKKEVKFCTECGKAVNPIDKAKKSTWEKAKELSEKSKPQTKKTGSKKSIIFIFSLIILILFAVFLFKIFYKDVKIFFQETNYTEAEQKWVNSYYGICTNYRHTHPDGDSFSDPYEKIQESNNPSIAYKMMILNPTKYVFCECMAREVVKAHGPEGGVYFGKEDGYPEKTWVSLEKDPIEQQRGSAENMDTCILEVQEKCSEGSDCYAHND